MHDPRLRVEGLREHDIHSPAVLRFVAAPGLAFTVRRQARGAGVSRLEGETAIGDEMPMDDPEQRPLTVLGEHSLKRVTGHQREGEAPPEIERATVGFDVFDGKASGLFPRPRQHRRAQIDADDLDARLGDRDREAARAAGHVEHRPALGGGQFQEERALRAEVVLGVVGFRVPEVLQVRVGDQGHEVSCFR